MTFIDNQGLEITANNAEQIAILNQATEILFRKKGINKLLPAINENNPNGCPLLLAYLAIMYFFSFSRAEIEKKFPEILNQIQIASLNAREIRYYNALQQIFNNNLHAATEVFVAILKEYPKDKVAILMLETCAFLSGKLEVLELLFQKLFTYHFNDVDFLGNLAFYFCHSNKKEEAQKIVLAALQKDPHNAWLQHVYAHSLDENIPEDINEGIKFLESKTNDWPAQNRFFEGHNWMHLLMLYFKAKKSIPNLNTLYEKHIWSEAKAFIFEQNNAFISLWYGDLYHQKINEYAWEDLASYAEQYATNYFTPYLTLTAILTVAKVNIEKTKEYKKELEQYILTLDKKTEAYFAWQSSLLPLDGCLYYIRKDYNMAHSLLRECSEEKTRLLGHSDEQRSFLIDTARYCHFHLG